MSTLHDRIAGKPGGEKALAAGRLRREVLVALHRAFEASGLHTQTEIARRLGVRRSAVSQVFKGGGNLRINTLAEYLFTLGFEVDLTLVAAGEPRRAMLEGRAVVPTDMAWNTTVNVLVIAVPDRPGYLSTYTPSEIWVSWQVQHPYREFEPAPNSTFRQIIVGEGDQTDAS
jgi:transcriptional regulator with XRE-family HTH domain